MRWIQDSDLQRLKLARRDLDNESLAAAMIDSVLENMRALEQEQAYPEPRIAALSETERRKIYPDRYVA